MTWSEASAACQAAGMGLADFRAEEDLAVRTVIRKETVDKCRKTITSTTTSKQEQTLFKDLRH